MPEIKITLFFLFLCIHTVYSAFFVNPNFLCFASLIDNQITLQYLSKSKGGYSFIEIGRYNNDTQMARYFFQSGGIYTRNSSDILISYINEERVTYRGMISGVTLNLTNLLKKIPSDFLFVQYGYRQEGIFSRDPYLDAVLLQLNFSTTNISTEPVDDPLISNRIEYIRPEWCIIAMVPYLGNIFVFFFFSRKQPLKSRGIMPLFGSILLFIHFAGGLIPNYLLNYEQIINSDCQIYFLVQQASLFAAVAFHSFQYFRFLAMFHLSLKKDIWYEKEEKAHHIPLYFRVIKWMGTLLGQILMSLFLLVVHFSVFGIFAAATLCDRSIMKWVLVGSTAWCCLVIVILLAYDAIVCAPGIRKGECWNLVRRDGFYMRWEYSLFLIVLVPLGTCVQSIAIALDQIPFGKVRWPTTLTLAISNSIFFNLGYFFACGLPLYVTILTWLLSFCHRKKKQSRIEEVFANPELLGYFEEFAKSEYSPENLWLFLEIQKFRQDPDLNLGWHIYNTYLNGGKSELEVNVTMATRKVVKDALHLQGIDQDTFDPVLKEICDNMIDTYSRFTLCSDYIKYMNRTEQFKELTTPMI
jgi:hypothetical protein